MERNREYTQGGHNIDRHVLREVLVVGCDSQARVDQKQDDVSGGDDGLRAGQHRGPEIAAFVQSSCVDDVKC